LDIQTLDLRISTWNYEGYSSPATLEEAVRDAAGAGFGVEVWPTWRGRSGVFAADNRSCLKELLAGVRSSLHAAGIESIEDIVEQIDACAETESDVLVVHIDHLRVGSEPDFGFGREATSYASEKGVFLALENGELNYLVRALDRLSDLYICFDTGHAYVMDEFARPMHEFVNALKWRIRHLHLQDIYLERGTRRGLFDAHRTPGTCDIPKEDYEYLFEALDETGYKGAAVLEVRPFGPVEVAHQTQRFLESLSL